jgi:peptidyl-prolyl cis-trans isomerase C
MTRPVIVNGREVSEKAIALEMQYHRARDVADAWRQAATALVIRSLLLDECARHGIEEEDEETTIRSLLAREIVTPDVDADSCRRYWAANRARFRTPELYEAAHILFPAAPDDEPASAAAKQAAIETLRELACEPRRFDELARTRSACPSAANGGRLGQLTRGDLVPEIETFIFALDERQICPVPVITRYGAHVLRLDRRAAATDPPFEAVAETVARHLVTHSWQRAVSQYLRLLAGRAHIEGIDLGGVATPLVQ